MDLWRGLRAVSVELRETPELKALLARGTALFHRFLADALGGRVLHALDCAVGTTATLTTSFSERVTDEQQSALPLLQQADFPADLPIARFGLDQDCPVRDMPAQHTTSRPSKNGRGC